MGRDCEVSERTVRRGEKEGSCNGSNQEAAAQRSTRQTAERATGIEREANKR